MTLDEAKAAHAKATEELVAAEIELDRLEGISMLAAEKASEASRVRNAAKEKVRQAFRARVDLELAADRDERFGA